MEEATPYPNFCSVGIKEFLNNLNIAYCGINGYKKVLPNGKEDTKMLRPDKKLEAIQKDLLKNTSTHLSVYLKYSQNIYILDVDELNKGNAEIHSMISDILGFLPPFTLSSKKKKPHYYLYIDNFPIANFKHKTKCFTKCEGDFIKDLIVEANDTLVYYRNSVELKRTDWNILKEYIILDDVVTISTISKNSITKSNVISKGSKVVTELQPIVLELLDTLTGESFGDYDKWFNLLMTCKNVGISYESFDTFSKKCNGYNEVNNKELWDKYSVDNNKNLFGIPKLIEFAKNSDEGKTDSILKKYNYYNENYIIERIIEKNAHSDIACLYLSNNDGVLFYRVSKKTFLVYNKTTCLWEYLENDEVVLPSRINKCISPIIEKHLTVVKNKLKYLELNFKRGDEVQQKYLQDKIHKLQKIINNIGSFSFIKGVIAQLRSLCYEPENFFKNFDSKPNLFAFNNGFVYDLDIGAARNTLKEDYLTISCGYSYKDSNEEYIDLVKRFIYNYFEDQDVCDSYLSSVSLGLYGNNINEKFIIFTGSGRNGKSCMGDLIKYIFGDYYYPLDIAQLTSYSKGADAINTEKASLERKRFVIAEEPESVSKTFSLKTCTIKEWTGNSDLTVRTLHTSAYKFKPQFTLYLNCNTIPNLSKKDDAVGARLKKIQFPFSFTGTTEAECIDNVRMEDIRIKQSIKTEEFKYGFIHLLFRIYHKYRGKFYESIKVKNDTKEYLDEQNPIRNWFFKNYKVDPNGKQDKGDLYLHYCKCNKDIYISKSEFGKYVTELCGIRKSGIEYYKCSIICEIPKDTEEN
jgi:phage/plasmid-associated DNA primase